MQGPDGRQLHDEEARRHEGLDRDDRGRPGVVLDRARRDRRRAALTKAGVNVDSESISQKDTDFSALVAKVGSSTKVVFTPFQLSSQTQLLAQQLKSQGKKAVVFATDGSFDTSKFNVPGNYVSFFAADVTTIPADKAIVAAYHKQFPGGTSPFGAPNYVAAQLYAQAATKACAAGKGTITRAALRVGSGEGRRSRSRSSARRWRSPPNGDVAGAAFHIFKIVGGKYVRHALVGTRIGGGTAPAVPLRSLAPMNWNLFVTELVAGIIHGCVYALIALGYSMVYGILKLLNFAHGDVYMVGAFIGYGVLTVFGGATALIDPDRACCSPLMFLAAMLGGGLLGVAIERFAYRRLRDAPRIAPLITALGVSFFLENAALLLLGADYQSYDTFSWNNGSLWSNGFTLPSGVHVALAQIIVVVGTIVLMIALTLLRLAHAARPRDARDLVRPPGGRDDGHRREPRDRGDVLHRLGARGRGRRLQLPRLPAGLAVHGLRRRPEGLHRRRDRRHRQPAGRRRRRPHDRAARVLHDRVRLLDVLRTRSSSSS